MFDLTCSWHACTSTPDASMPANWYKNIITDLPVAGIPANWYALYKHTHNSYWQLPVRSM